MNQKSDTQDLHIEDDDYSPKNADLPEEDLIYSVQTGEDLKEEETDKVIEIGSLDTNPVFQRRVKSQNVSGN